MEVPWKTDKWFVSPWNYLPEVASEFRFADKIELHDVTLRDGEQQAGVVLRWDEKVRLAEKLAEAGVHRIEAGMAAVSKDDEKAIREIVKRNLGAKIFAFARCMVDDVKRAVDCGVDGVVIEIPSSEHLIKSGYLWPLQKAIDLSVEATRYAHDAGLYTVFFTIDATRADVEWLMELVSHVATEGHMDALGLVDTMGVCSPAAIRYFVRRVRARFPGVPLEAHFHNDFGLATANTLEALAQGVEVAHVSVCGTGERAGGAATEEVAVALRALYGRDIGIRLDKLTELARLTTDLTGHRIPANKCLVGERLFAVESGILTTWLRRCKGPLVTEVFPLHWDLLGQKPPTAVLGKGSGEDSVIAWLEDIGEDFSIEQVRAVLAEVKKKSLEKKGLLTREEFREIVDRIQREADTKTER